MKLAVFSLFSLLLLTSITLAQTSNVAISLDLENNKTYITKIGSDEFLFSYTYVADNETNLELEVILPLEYVVVDRGGLLVSRPVDISTDGRRIFMVWTASLKAGEEFSAFVQYQGKSQGVSLYVLILAFAIIAAIGAFVGHRLHIFQKEKFIKQVVSDDERIIVEEIKKKGEILQEDLRDSLGWSKTKISKVVRNLEVKKVIYKIPYKKTNKLKLK